MANRKDYYFKQPVTDSELNAGFDGLEAADRALASDLGFFGVVAGAQVVQHAAIANLTVDVGSGGITYDQTGERIFWAAAQLGVDVSQDHGLVATTVANPGNEKWVSLFCQFARALSDPRIDGLSNSLYFARDESFVFYVTQGAEAAIGTATRPPLESDKVLLADIHRLNGQTQILNANIDTTRRQDAVTISGSPQSIRRGRILDGLSDMLGFYNAHVTGGADKHTASMINYGGGSAWADGTTNPATDVESQLDKLVSDLASGAGAAKVHGNAFAGTTFSISAGTVAAQMAALLAAIESKRIVDFESGVFYSGFQNAGATFGAGSYSDSYSYTLTTQPKVGDTIITIWQFGIQRPGGGGTYLVRSATEENGSTIAGTVCGNTDSVTGEQQVTFHNLLSTRVVANATNVKAKLQGNAFAGGGGGDMIGPVAVFVFVLRTG